MDQIIKVQGGDSTESFNLAAICSYLSRKMCLAQQYFRPEGVATSSDGRILYRSSPKGFPYPIDRVVSVLEEAGVSVGRTEKRFTGDEGLGSVSVEVTSPSSDLSRPPAGLCVSDHELKVVARMLGIGGNHSGGIPISELLHACASLGSGRIQLYSENAALGSGGAIAFARLHHIADRLESLAEWAKARGDAALLIEEQAP